MGVFIDKPHVAATEYRAIAEMFLEAKSIRTTQYLGGVPNVTFRVDSSSSRLAIRVGNLGYTTQEHLLLELATLIQLQEAQYSLSPRLVCGLDGQYLQAWNGYPVIATDFIKGTDASKVQVSSELCEELGKSVGSLVTALREIRHPAPKCEEFWPRVNRLIDASPDVLYRRDLVIEKSLLTKQFERARVSLEKEPSMSSQLIHTDVWPPNVIVRGTLVVGIVDFDDMSFGPAVIDFSAAVAEFAIDDDCRIITNRFKSFLRGYRLADKVTELTADVVTAAIEACYTGWLVCNSLHGVPSAESMIYASRLAILREESNRRRLLLELSSIL